MSRWRTPSVRAMTGVPHGFAEGAPERPRPRPAQTRLVHFVGFRDDRYWNAVRVFGPPDMIHRNWDVYAANDVAEGDIVVHARGDWTDAPRSFSTEAEENRRARRARSGTRSGRSR